MNKEEEAKQTGQNTNDSSSRNINTSGAYNEGTINNSGGINISGGHVEGGIHFHDNRIIASDVSKTEPKETAKGNSMPLLKLEQSNKNKLVELLLNCPCTKTSSGRQYLLEQLPDKIQHSVSFGATDSATTAIYAIVNTYVNYYGANLASLLQAVDFFEKNSLPYQNLRNFTYEYIPIRGWYSEGRLEALETLINNACLDIVTVRSLYSRVIPRSENSLISIKNMIERLADDRNPVCIMEFVENLGLKYLPVQAQLQDWINQTCQQLNINFTPAGYKTLSSNIDSEKKESDITHKERPYLTIMLRPVPSTRTGEPDTFYVQAWFYKPGAKTGVNLKANIKPSDEAYSKKDLYALLGKLVTIVGDKLPPEQATQLVIEFIVNRDMFCSEIEVWNFTQVKKIGITYPVVIRAWERLYTDNYKPNEAHWRNNWNQLTHKVCDESMHWVYESETDNNEELIATIAQKKCVGLGLQFIPPVVQDINNCISAILESGIPVAVWPRQKFDTLDVQKELMGRLKNKTLADLPEVILAMRQEARSQASQPHVGHGLVLFWDDPTRQPKITKYNAPALAS